MTGDGFFVDSTKQLLGFEPRDRWPQGIEDMGGPTAPYWVELVRSGNTFTGYYSADGVNWTQEGSATVPMNATVYVGLAVGAVNNSALNTSTFDSVAVTSGGTTTGFPAGGASRPGGLYVSSGQLTLTAAGSPASGTTTGAMPSASAPLAGSRGGESALSGLAVLLSRASGNALASATNAMLPKPSDLDSPAEVMGLSAAFGASCGRHESTGGSTRHFRDALWETLALEGASLDDLLASARADG